MIALIPTQIHQSYPLDETVKQILQFVITSNSRSEERVREQKQNLITDTKKRVGEKKMTRKTGREGREMERDGEEMCRKQIK